MKASLVSLDYNIPSCDTSLRDLSVLIGSSPDAGIYLEDPSVSGCHCRIEKIRGQFVVSDLGSVHGTFVNGIRVSEWALSPGDVLGVGMLSFFLLCTEESEESWENIEEEAAFIRSRTVPLVDSMA
jgi:ABC transport system ATP-binding/permease protein